MVNHTTARRVAMPRLIVHELPQFLALHGARHKDLLEPLAHHRVIRFNAPCGFDPHDHKLTT